MCVHQQRARARAKGFSHWCSSPDTHTHRPSGCDRSCRLAITGGGRECTERYTAVAVAPRGHKQKRNCWMNKWHLIRLYINSYTCNTPKHNWREHRECTQPSARPFPVFLPIYARFDLVFPWLYPSERVHLVLVCTCPASGALPLTLRQARCGISTGFYTSTQTRWYFLIHQTQLTSRWMKHDFPLSISLFNCLSLPSSLFPGAWYRSEHFWRKTEKVSTNQTYLRAMSVCFKFAELFFVSSSTF